MSNNARPNISALPPKLRLKIIRELDPYPKAQFALKMTSAAFLVLCPSWEELRAHSQDAHHKYLLACLLNRSPSPENYLCSGCRTRHPASFFLPSMWTRSDSVRVCMAHRSSIPVMPRAYLSYQSAREFMEKWVEKRRRPPSIKLNSTPGAESTRHPVSSGHGIYFNPFQVEGPQYHQVRCGFCRVNNNLVLESEINLPIVSFELLMMYSCKKMIQKGNTEAVHRFLDSTLEANNIPLCSHINLENDAVFSAICDLIFHQYGRRKIQHTEKELSCDVCKADILVWVDKTPPGAQQLLIHELKIRVTRNLGKCTGTVDAKWRRHINGDSKATWGKEWVS